MALSQPLDVFSFALSEVADFPRYTSDKCVFCSPSIPHDEVKCATEDNRSEVSLPQVPLTFAVTAPAMASYSDNEARYD
jgi:hypothetical protein